MEAYVNGVPTRGPQRRVPDRLPHSDLIFDCADIEATYAELSAREVRFPLLPVRQCFGWWALFEDHEGTRYGADLRTSLPLGRHGPSRRYSRLRLLVRDLSSSWCPGDPPR